MRSSNSAPAGDRKAFLGAAPRVPRDPMNCPKCGTDLPANASYCTTCGASIGATELALRGAEEVVTRDELRALLSKGGRPRAYVGLEPSGLMHIGTGFIVASKVTDLVRAGFHTILFLSDWHAYINDKLGGDLKAIQACGEYFKDGFRALGVPNEVEFLYANEFVSRPSYWQKVLQVSKASSVSRIKRALTIMGRKEEEEIG